MSLPRIYVTCAPQPSAFGDCDLLATAQTAEGVVIAQHICSSEYWVRHDMGFTSNWKHDAYSATYPQGWELVWGEPPSPVALS